MLMREDIAPISMRTSASHAYYAHNMGGFNAGFVSCVGGQSLRDEKKTGIGLGKWIIASVRAVSQRLDERVN